MTVKNITRILFICFIGSLILGQFSRFQLSPSVAIYFHDIFLISLYFILVLKVKKIPFKIDKPIIVPLILISSAVVGSFFISLIRNPLPDSSALLYLVRFLLYLWLIPILITFRKRNFLPSLQQSLLLLGGGLASGGLVQYALYPDTRSLFLLGWDNHYYRAIGTLFDPNFLGLLMVLTLLLTQYLKTATSTVIKVIAFLTLLLTYSRSSYLAFFVALVGVSIYQKNRLLLAAGAIILGVSIILLPRPYGEGVRLERTASIGRRQETQNFALKIWQTHPIFGIGFNNYRYYWESQAKQSPYSGHTSAPDNSFLFILVTTGLIGTSLVVVAILKLLIYLKNPLFTLSVIATSIHSLANNSFFYPWVIIWLCLLVVENKKTISLPRQKTGQKLITKHT